MWQHRILLAGILVAARMASAADSPIPLWQLQPFDRIYLINEEKYDIDPVRLPGGFMPNAPQDEYIGQPGLPPVKELQRGVKYRIRVQPDGSEYYVYGRYLVRVEYYEDLLLAEANNLISLQKYDLAYEFLRTIERRQPDWPGLLEARVAFHREEGNTLSLQGRYDRAFFTLRDEYRLRRSAEEQSPSQIDADLARRIDQVASRWIERSTLQRDFAEGRKIVARLESFYPDSPIARGTRENYERRARELVSNAEAQRSANNPGEASLSLVLASRIVPDSAFVRAALDEQFKRFALLRVAVEDLPRYYGGLSTWTVADWRASQLINVPLMQWRTVENQSGFESQVIASLEQENVNKRAQVMLRENLRWPSDDKPVTAVDLYRLLRECCDNTSPLYEPALARLVATLEPQYPLQLRIDFGRPQYQPQSWLQMPFLRVGQATLDRSRTGTNFIQGLGPFQILAATDAHVDLVANARFLEPGRPRIHRVREIRYPEAADRLRALRNHEAEIVAPVMPRHWDRVALIPGARLVTLSQPRIHVLQFDLNRRELRSRTLRRAFDYAIDRSALFAKVGIKPDDTNRVVTAPLPYGTFGYDTKIEARPYQPQLAKALILALRSDLKGIAPFRLSHPGDELSRTVCEEIASQLQKVGLNVTTTSVSSRSAGNELGADLRYQSLTVSDPLHDQVTLLTRDNPSLGRYGSEWFRQLLVDATQIPNESAARTLLPEVHRVIHEDVVILPLWQWQEKIAVADVVHDMPASPASTYHQVGEWTLEPNYPDAHWATIRLDESKVAGVEAP